MTWLDRFTVAAEALKTSIGAAVDLASAPFDQDEESFAQIIGDLGQMTIGGANAVAQAGVGLAGGALWAADKASENLVLEPLSTAATAAALPFSPTSTISGWGQTWSKAHEIAQTRSFGQSVVVGVSGTDVLDNAEIERMKQGFLFNAVSGTIDAAANIFADPTIVLGKGATAVKVVRKGFGAGFRASDPWLVRQIAKRTSLGVGDIDPYDYSKSKAVDEFLNWTDSKSGRQIGNHAAVAASPYRSVLAGLFQDADTETKRLIVAVGYGSKKALGELAMRRDDLAMRVARADNQVNFALQYEVSRGWRDKMPMPAIRRPKGAGEPPSEQLPLFDIGAFPKGTPGVKGSGSAGGSVGAKISEPLPVRGVPTSGAAGKGYDYPGVSGNFPKTVEGQYFIAPKTAKEGGPYWMQGPVDADSVREMIPYFNAEAKRKSAEKWEQLTIPGLPKKDSQWKAASSWRQHDTTLGQTVDDWNEQMSMRIMPWDRQATKWFLSYQKELSQKTGKELDLLNAAVGSGGEGRGIWGSMTNQVISGDKQLRKADKTLAYDWETRSGVAERIIQPKAYGLPVRVIQGVPFHVARSFSEKRPPSWIDPNRGDSHAAFAAYLNSADIFDAPTKDTLMRRYLSAYEPTDKRELLARTEATAIRNMAKKYGLSDDAAAEIAARSVGERNSVITQLRKNKSNSYAADAAVTKSNSPFEDFPVDDDLIPVTSPILETQEVNSIPLLDLEKYDRAFRANAETLGAFDRTSASIADFMDKAYDVLNPLWSFSVLMRLGYTVRTLTDDMLRIWASLGSMSIMGNISAGVRNMTSGGALKQRARNVKTGLQRTAIGALAAASPKDVAAALRSQVDDMGRDIGSVTSISDLGWTYRGRQIAGPYEGRGDTYRQVVGGSYEALARTSGEIIEKLRSDYAHWDVKNPDDADHLDSWVYAVNNQIAKSAVGRRFLQGQTGEQVERWLRTSAEGQQVRKKIGTFGRDPQRLAGLVQATVDQYVPLLRDSADPMALRRLALQGKLDRKTLEEVFPNVGDRPQVHGPTVDLNLHRGALHQFMDSVVSNGFKWLSQIPSDKLMRHPTFRSLYQDSVRKQYDSIARQLGDEVLITGDDIAAMEHGARESALRGVNNLLYDVSTKSNAAHAARFVTSFFSAWEDSITKWSRLAMDKPQLLFIGSKLYDAPNEMNLGSSLDESGNRVPRIQVVDSQGKPISVEDSTVDDESRIVARLPKWLIKAIPGAEEFGSVAIPKSSLNLILQGNPWWLPGAGPLAQVAVSEIAKRQPTIKNVYDWAIPYGSSDVSDVMLPGWLKQMIKGNTGVDDPAYAAIYLQIAQTEEMRVRTGTRTRPSPTDFEKEIKRRTDAAFKIRSYTRFFAPFTADLQSPYQFYIDQYRQLADASGPDADEMFYERYGEDLYMFTTALSKNNVGLRASENAYRAGKEYKDLIAAHPEYGALIVGTDANTGAFNQYVHEAQFNEQISPGSTKTFREKRSPIESLADNDKSVGWLQYKRFMGLVKNMENTGSYSDPQIAAARKAVVEFIGESHANWLADFQESDRAAMPRRIEVFRELSANPKLVNNPMRTDLRVLSQYITVRDQFLAQLAALKASGRPHTLEAEVNAPIAKAWDLFKRQVSESDTKFGDLYWRYLDNDELQI